jgi:hypothetical protein
MMRRLGAFLLVLLSTPLVAQSVQPAVVEYTGNSEGQYEVVNDSLLPLYVTIEAKSFTIDAEGNARFAPLSSSVHLSLSQTSLVVPPHGRRTVFYVAKADVLPAWFCIYSNFSGLPRRGAMNVALELPHTVYLRAKQEARREDISLEGLHVEGGELRGVARNQSANMVRLQSLQVVTGDGRKREEGGFPLLPGGVRELHLPLDPGVRPEHLRAKLARFTIEGDVR